jgi:hypothetical protein
MEKCNFVAMINAIEKYDAEVERWADFGIELYELPICELTWELINMYLEEMFNKDGIDWINWYIYERKSIFTGEVLPCFDEEGNEFYVNTPEDLWKLVEQHQK